MAKPPRYTKHTLLPLIPSGDMAIGDGADYEKYRETGDESLLDLAADVKPDYFWLKRPGAQDHVALVELVSRVMAGVSEEDVDLTSPEQYAKAKRQTADYEAFATETVIRSVRGFDAYEIVPEVAVAGDDDVIVLSQKKGDSEPPPEKTCEILAEDPDLVRDIYFRLMHFAQLSEAAKKA